MGTPSKTSTAVAPTASQREIMLRTFAEAAQSMVSEDQTSEDIVLDILNADTVDAILESTAVGLETIVGVPFTIIRAILRESDFTDGLPAYLVMHVTLDSGEPMVITTGAQSVVAQVIRMNQLGVLPYRVSSRKATKPTKLGYYPMSLTKAPEADESF